MTPAEASSDPVVALEANGLSTGQKILYPVFADPDGFTVEVALEIARGSSSDLIVLDLVREGTSVRENSRPVAQKLLDAKQTAHDEVQVRTIVEPSATPRRTARRVARNVHPNLVVFDSRVPRKVTDHFRGLFAKRLGTSATSDVLRVSEGLDPANISSILVPIGEECHSDLGAAIAGAIALGTGATIELFHVSDPTGSRESGQVDDLFSRVKRRIPRSIECQTWHHEAENVAAAIADQGPHYDITVMGESGRSRVGRVLWGTVASDVGHSTNHRVLQAWHPNGGSFQV